MLRVTLTCLALLAPATTLASQASPTQAELNDWTTFQRSVLTPAAAPICDPLLPGKAAYSQSADKWLKANSAAIERGHQFILASLKPGQTVEKQNAYMVGQFKDKVLAMAEADRREFCVRSQHMLEETAK